MLEESFNRIRYEISQGNYQLSAKICEEILDSASFDNSIYCLLGISLLLMDDEIGAQVAWLTGLDNTPSSQLGHYLIQFSEILEEIATGELNAGRKDSSWLIRQHFQSLIPENIDNLFKILVLSIDREEHPELLFEESLFLSLVKERNHKLTDFELEILLNQVFVCVPYDKRLVIWIDYISKIIEIEQGEYFSQFIFSQADRIGYELYQYGLATDLMEIVVLIVDNVPSYWNALSANSRKYGLYDRSAVSAQKAYDLQSEPIDLVFSLRMKISALLESGGKWNEAFEVFSQYQNLLQEIIDGNLSHFNRFSARQLMSTLFFTPYFQDIPVVDKKLQSQIVALCKTSMQMESKDYFVKYQKRHNSSTTKDNGKIKIGYISHCFRLNSVGWLSRWLIKYHDRDKFEVYAYSVNHLNDQSDVQKQFIEWADYFYILDSDTHRASEQIFEDGIDILIDLDSLTLDVTYEVMSLKPAPIQATWLGWDSLCMDTIDYFIADEYVLPPSADSYYTEEIWRLPNSYIAIDGFESGTPDINRTELSIPENSVIFFTGQRGFKRNPACCRLQLEILKGVPDSYLLIKGIGSGDTVKHFFEGLAQEVGVNLSRLRFLPETKSELTHRANLRIADVVLDTYPYNGATTTMETLWMEVPIVTRVGEQFAARNSYTMMMNAGITEGIAWSAEEYVEWGIKLGTDAKLRQDVSWRLRESKKTSPLWDGKKFTRQMEDAYQQMWQTYVDSNS